MKPRRFPTYVHGTRASACATWRPRLRDQGSGRGAQARSDEAGNVRMRLEKAERAIEAERATVRELQRQLVAAGQVPRCSPGALTRS